MIRGIWALCLLIGSANHARILLKHGLLWDYGGANPASAVYWSSLTLLDPLVAVLLFVRPRVGILATFVLMVTNVAHNVAITAHYTPPDQLLARVTAEPYLVSQIIFLLFVVMSAPLAWRGLSESNHPPLTR